MHSITYYIKNSRRKFYKPPTASQNIIGIHKTSNTKERKHNK